MILNRCIKVSNSHALIGRSTRMASLLVKIVENESLIRQVLKELIMRRNCPSMRMNNEISKIRDQFNLCLSVFVSSTE